MILVLLLVAQLGQFGAQDPTSGYVGYEGRISVSDVGWVLPRYHGRLS